MAQVTSSIKKDLYRIDIKTPSGNTIHADEPVDKGGKDSGFSPKELLTAALSACTSATLRMYADRKGWDLQEVRMEVELLENDESSLFSRKIELIGNLDEAQKKRLLFVANSCPVHKILSHPIEFHTQIAD